MTRKGGDDAASAGDGDGGGAARRATGGTNGVGSCFDAHRLALGGDVVVVTINYRLGVFGAFGYPGLAGSGTFGLADQEAALRWVQRNITSSPRPHPPSRLLHRTPPPLLARPAPLSPPPPAVCIQTVLGAPSRGRGG